MTKEKESKAIRVATYKFEDIDKHIGLVKRDGEKLQNKIHALAITILSHWANNPEDGPLCAQKITDLQAASPYHSRAFADWVALKTGMNWSEETEVWYVQAGQKFRKDKLDSAKNEPFWVVSKPTPPKPLTDEMILKSLQSILDKQQKHEKNKVEGDDFSHKANEHIRAAIAALKTL